MPSLSVAVTRTTLRPSRSGTVWLSESSDFGAASSRAAISAPFTLNATRLTPRDERTLTRTGRCSSATWAWSRGCSTTSSNGAPAGRSNATTSKPTMPTSELWILTYCRTDGAYQASNVPPRPDRSLRAANSIRYAPTVPAVTVTSSQPTTVAVKVPGTSIARGRSCRGGRCQVPRVAVRSPTLSGHFSSKGGENSIVFWPRTSRAGPRLFVSRTSRPWPDVNT